VSLAATALFALTACAARPSATSQPGTPAPRDSSGSAASHVWRSARFGFTWTLAPEWSFVASESDQAIAPMADSKGAAKAVGNLPIVWVFATDTVSSPGRPDPPHDEKYFEKLAEYGTSLLRHWGVEQPAPRRVEMLGREMVEVVGDGPETRESLRLFEVGRRRFFFRCYEEPLYADPSGKHWPCESAFRSFEIAEPPEPVTESETPHVLHLRDERFGFDFDAPDDSWLAIGPRVGGGGAQLVWTWAHDRRQIDVHVLDLSWIPETAVSEELVAAQMAKAGRREGKKVLIKHSTLSGSPCHHLQIDAHGFKQDMFILVRDQVNYSLLITEPERDAAFIAKVKQGLRVRPRTPTGSSSGGHASQR